MQYDRMMEGALRSVVREALGVAAAAGLPGEHHFYVTFRTDYPGVEIPARLRSRHPEEMTIVLQHQFWGLEVDANQFQVTLSFDRVHETLKIPLAAITAFVDPSVQFGLQFPHVAASVATLKAAPEKSLGKKAETPAAPPADAAAPAAAEAPADASARVVTLDAFRKK
ncbi:MAG: hypothetical protein ING44_06785 [Telmatospirillum sp.]|nr:hypothetical protein [Telmatospirillum sp.]